VTKAKRRITKSSKIHKLRTIYSAKNRQTLLGTMVRNEGDPPTGDLAVDEAYDYSGNTYDFFWNVYRRNSIDDHGMPLISIVHYGKSFDNAFWNGKQLIFGDGDGKIFNRFTCGVDLIAKELTKGIVQTETKLTYLEQSGALIESISDVFGSLVKQYILKQTAAEADWIVGKDLFTKNIKGVGLRSLKAPGTAYDDPMLGKDPQREHMKNSYKGTADNGGVHINSGIPNHAFYLIAIALGGFAWEKAGRIWYEAIKDRSLKPNSRFRDFARITLSKTREVYGHKSEEAKVVRYGWESVGLKLTR